MSSRCIKESLAGDHHDDESSVRLCLLLTTMLMSMVIYMYIYIVTMMTMMSRWNFNEDGMIQVYPARKPSSTPTLPARGQTASHLISRRIWLNQELVAFGFQSSECALRQSLQSQATGPFQLLPQLRWRLGCEWDRHVREEQYDYRSSQHL